MAGIASFEMQREAETRKTGRRRRRGSRAVAINFGLNNRTRRWGHEAREIMGSTISSLYSNIIVSLYIAFSFMELTKFPENKDFLEIYGFFTYMYSVAVAYLLYVLCYVVAKPRDELRVVECKKSHGSIAVRIGVIVFGLGALVYYVLELLRFLELLRNQGPCFHPTVGLNACLALVFTILQAYVIFTYPRLNCCCNHLLNRFGTMHLVALNIIIWVRTLIKETLEEIVEYQRDQHKKFVVQHSGKDEEKENTCNSLLRLMKLAENETEVCNEYRHDIMGDVAVAAMPYLYPFMIEFALIGASVAYIMSRHVGKPPPEEKALEASRVRLPDPKAFVRKADCGHSLVGFLLGAIVLVAAVVSLITFFGLDGHEQHADEGEILSKASNIILNSIGIVACLVGLHKIEHLEQREGSDAEDKSFDLDNVLLRFSSSFAFIYMMFTIMTGAFNSNVEGFPNGLHSLDGITEIVQIVLQIIFIHNLKGKRLPEYLRETRPGRQITFFLFLFNMAQWLVFTFEIQKVRASLVEANFYGFMPWVIIRRVTLPLAVFFRFHSFVVSIELWKEVYAVEDETPSDDHVQR